MSAVGKARIARAFLVPVLLLLAPLSARAHEPGGKLVDSLSPSTANTVRVQGEARREVLRVRIGSLEEEYPVLAFGAAPATAEFQLAVEPAAGPRPLLLEIQEIHNRNTEVFAYTVNVNGRDIYFRTYEETAAGPNHFFVPIPAGLAPDGKLAVTIRNESHAPFAISQVWAYTDLWAMADTEGTRRPMPVVEEASVLLGTKGKIGEIAGWNEKRPDNPEQDAKLWEQLRPRFERSPFRPGIFSNLQYGLQPIEQVEATIKGGLERSARLQIDSQVAFNASEWGHHPNGPDGRGGYFSDIDYSKIGYNPATQTWHPSWPGSPGGTTWPTWNHPVLNEFLAYRLNHSVRNFVSARDFLKARGQNMPAPLLNQEWGMSIPDFNDATVEAAAKDGVSLDPTDGLSEIEKHWLFRNVAEVPRRFADVVTRALGSDSIVLDRGDLVLPTRQTLDDYFFQTFAESKEPFFDDRWAGWQPAVARNVWVTGEFLPGIPESVYDYLAARGKLTCPNLERMGLPNLDYLDTLYERGLQHVTLINGRWGDGALFLEKSGDLDARPGRPPVHHDRKLLDLRFDRDETPGGPGQVAESVNIHRAPDDKASSRAPALAPVLNAHPARIVYRVPSGSAPFSGPLWLKLTVKLPEKSPAFITISAGSDLAALQPVKSLSRADFTQARSYPWKSTSEVDLGNLFQGKQEAYVAIEFPPTDQDQPVAIEKLTVSERWPQKTGSLTGHTMTVGDNRLLSLWLQDRAVTARLLERFRGKQGGQETIREAQEMMNSGRHRSAYEFLAGEISKLLPARYAVRGHGRLSPYPLSVQLSSPDRVVLVDLLQVGPDGCDLRLTSEADQTCEVHWTELKPGTTATAEMVAPGHFLLKTGNDTDPLIADAGGNITFTLRAVASSAPKLPPGTFAGVCAGITHEHILIETQDAALWRDNPYKIKIAPSRTVERTLNGSPVQSGDHWPKQRDAVNVTIDAQGRAVRIEAARGADMGRIKSFQPPSPKEPRHNGILELENGRSYEFSNQWHFTALQVPGLKEFIRFNTPDELAKVLRPGLEVELEYIPSATEGGRPPRMIRLKSPTPAL